MIIATDPLSLVFIFCFLLGLGFFLAVSLMGGHGHSHVGHLHIHLPGLHHTSLPGGSHAPAQVSGTTTHGATQPSSAHTGSSTTSANNQPAAQPTPTFVSYLNPTSIAFFLLGFGFFGYFFHNLTPVATSLSLLLAIICGIALAGALLLFLSRIFANVESSTEQDVVDRTGMLGKVSITIPEKGLGEIIYTSPAGMHKSIPARGLDNQRVERDLEVVVVNYQNGIAEVDTWEHFMHGEMHLPDPSPADEMTQLRTLLDQSAPDEIEMVMRQEWQKE